MWESLPLLLTFLCTTGVFFAMALLFYGGDQRVDDRVRDYSKGFTPIQIDQVKKTPSKLKQSVSRAAKLLLPKDQKQRQHLRQQLVHAGYYSPTAPAIYIAVQLLCVTAIALTLYLVSSKLLPGAGDQILFITAGACLGFLAPVWWLRGRKAQRTRVLNKSLPDFLDLTVSCLEAGLSIEAVIQRIGQDLSFAHPLLASEIVRVQREIELGATADRALLSLAERTDSETVRAISVVCLQSRRYGAKIAKALRTHADLLRDQREQLAEEAAQKASVRILMPALLLLFPVTLTVLAGPAAIQIQETFGGRQAASLE
jgi:tight adherence protein C